MHNNPEDLRPQPGVKHLTFCLPDVATANIAPLFQSSYVFIEEAKKLGHGEATCYACLLLSLPIK